MRCQFARLIYGAEGQVGGERAVRETWSGDEVSWDHVVRHAASRPAWHSFESEDRSVVCTRRIQWPRQDSATAVSRCREAWREPVYELVSLLDGLRWW